MVYHVAIVAVARAILLIGVGWAVALALTATAALVLNTRGLVFVDDVTFIAVAVAIVFK